MTPKLVRCMSIFLRDYSWYQKVVDPKGSQNRKSEEEICVHNLELHNFHMAYSSLSLSQCVSLW